MTINCNSSPTPTRTQIYLLTYLHAYNKINVRFEMIGIKVYLGSVGRQILLPLPRPVCGGWGLGRCKSLKKLLTIKIVFKD